MRPPLLEDFRDPSDQETTTMIPTELNNSLSTISVVASFEDTFMFLLHADPVM